MAADYTESAAISAIDEQALSTYDGPMDTQSIRLNGHTVARILIDPAPLDPREINREMDEAEGLYIGDIDLIVGTRGDSAAPSWFHAFRQLTYKLNTDTALRAMNILRSMGAKLPGYIGVRNWRGYAPGAWAGIVVAGPNEETAEGYYQTYAAWARGDVYGIMLERKCPVTGGWFTVEDELALYGNYWTGIGSFEEEVREIAEFNWNLDEEPVSEEGKALVARRELKADIDRKIERYTLLATAQGDTTLDLAREIFAGYESLLGLNGEAADED